MSYFRPRMFLLVVALASAIAAVYAHFERLEEMRANMGLYARVLTAFDESHTGLISVLQEDGGMIAEANDAACDIFGYKRGELAGTPVNAVLPDDFRSYHDAVMKKAIENARAGHPHVSTVRCLALRKDGKTVDVFVRMFVTNGGVVAIISLSGEMVHHGIDAPFTAPQPPPKT